MNFIEFLICFLSGMLLGHVCTKRFDNIALTEEEANKWFKKGFHAGCAETADMAIRYRFKQEEQKEAEKYSRDSLYLRPNAAGRLSFY